MGGTLFEATRGEVGDPALDTVLGTLSTTRSLEERAGKVRSAFDEVLDGARTRRWDIRRLEKTEKTYIGTKLEILLVAEFGWERGATLDIRVGGEEVDIKFSLSGSWMIPIEAVDELIALTLARSQLLS